MTEVTCNKHCGLEMHGIKHASLVHRNLSPANLIEHALRRGEGLLASNGALVVRTNRTGRSPKDKFIVKDFETEGVIWWGSINQPFEQDNFEILYQKVLAYLQGRELFVKDCFVGADPRYCLSVRVVTEYAWHSLFAHQLFLRDKTPRPTEYVPDFIVISAPGFKSDPLIDGTHSEVFVIVNFSKRVVLIGGTEYAGEIKKSVFTIMNYLMPKFGVLPMHCSANMGKRDGEVALFFGLSGTGKTSLSSDPDRFLIGDDEHGWSEEGIFNFEGGCYAKCIRLSEEKEPLIWNAIRFGAVVENVVINTSSRLIDFDDDSVTENTRAGYPLDFIEGALIPSTGGHPKHIFFLTCDAFGVLPPIAKLTYDQAMEQFLLGYTAKVAGTEAGVTEPQATFSTCFGAPFLPLPPTTYAEMLSKKLNQHQTQVWLVNTGWIGGPYGVGSRIPINYTRAMVQSAMQEKLNEVKYYLDPVFCLQVPINCPQVPPEILDPRRTWKDKDAYDHQAKKLADMWDEQIKQIKLGLATADGTVG